MRKGKKYNFYYVFVPGDPVNIHSSSFPLTSSFFPHTIEKIDLDIIEFLARNGPQTVYTMKVGVHTPKKRGRPRDHEIWIRQITRKSNALNYNYKTLARRVETLKQMGLLQHIELEGKMVYSLTFLGFHGYVRMVDRNPEDLDRAISSNCRLIPFFKYWTELINRAGKTSICDSLTNATSETIFTKHILLEELNLYVDTLFISPDHKPIFAVKENEERQNEILQLLSEKSLLKNSYLIYLILNDILFLYSQKKWPKNPEESMELESEKAYAFLEKNKKSQLLFVPGILLKQLLEKYNFPVYFFSGLFMDKLLQNQL